MGYVQKMLNRLKIVNAYDTKITSTIFLHGLPFALFFLPCDT